jgi:hypothetical protein
MKTIENYGQVGDDYSLIEMCGRMVQVKNRKEGELALTRKYAWENVDTLGATCADCGIDAPFVIKELSEDRNWCYCGVCCVGG